MLFCNVTLTVFPSRGGIFVPLSPCLDLSKLVFVSINGVWQKGFVVTSETVGFDLVFLKCSLFKGPLLGPFLSELS